MSAGGILVGAPRCSLRGESGYDLQTTASRFNDPSARISGGSRFRRRRRVDRGERPSRPGSGVSAARVLPSSPGPLHRDLHYGTKHSLGQERKRLADARNALERLDLCAIQEAGVRYDEIMPFNQTCDVLMTFHHDCFIISSFISPIHRW